MLRAVVRKANTHNNKAEAGEYNDGYWATSFAWLLDLSKAIPLTVEMFI
jgi:hypothetical protein